MGRDNSEEKFSEIVTRVQLIFTLHTVLSGCRGVSPFHLYVLYLLHVLSLYLADVQRGKGPFPLVTQPRVVTHSITTTSCLLHHIPTATDPNLPLPPRLLLLQATYLPHAMDLPSCSPVQNITMAPLFSSSSPAHQAQTTSRLYHCIHRFWPLVEQNITYTHLSD
jgi:hypothetical protein